MYTYARYLGIPNGDFAGSNPYKSMPRYMVDPVPRYIRNGHDLGEYVHRDFSHQRFLGVCLILLGMNATLDLGNPYHQSRTQSGFATFGEAHVMDLVARVANYSLRAAWFQNWLVHRRIRPEAFGGHVHLHRKGVASFPIHSQLLNSPA